MIAITATLAVMSLLMGACVEVTSAPDDSPTDPEESSKPVTPTPSPTATALAQTPSPSETPDHVSTPAPTPDALVESPMEATSILAPGAPDSADHTNPPYVLSCEAEPFLDFELTRAVLHELGDLAPGFSIVVQELTTGARAELNADRSYYAASLYKTAVMFNVFQQVEAGTLSLDQYVEIDDFYASQDLGTLGSLGWEPGTQITIAEALHATITVSDNATAYLLGDLVGWPEIDDALRELGAGHTEFWQTELPTTASDMSLLLEAIACGTGVSETSSQSMLDNLAAQQIDHRIPRDLPPDAVVAHKTGDWYNASHDAGIVYGSEAVYVIVVMSSFPGADDPIARVSAAVYEQFHGIDNRQSGEHDS